MIKIVGLVAVSLVFMLPSMAINAVHQLEHTPGPMAYPLAGAAVLSVLLAGSSPFAMELAVKERRVGLFLMALTAFVVCCSYNLVSAVGAASVARSEITGDRASAARVTARLTAQLKAAELARGQHGAVANGQTAAQAEAVLAGMRVDAKFSRSASCMNVTLPDSRSFCAEFANKQAVKDAAAKVEELDREIKSLNAQLTASSTASSEGPADPQADTLAALLGSFGLKLSAASVGKGLSITFAMVIETLGSLGPVVFVALVRLFSAVAGGHGGRQAHGHTEVVQGGPHLVREVVHGPVQDGPRLVHFDGDQPVEVVHGLAGASHPGPLAGPQGGPQVVHEEAEILLLRTEETVESLALAGLSEREIAKRMGIGKTSVNRRLKALRAAGRLPN